MKTSGLYTLYRCLGWFKLPGLKTSGLPRAIGVRTMLPPRKNKSATQRAASRWLNTLCISLWENKSEEEKTS